jgi:hypothetical protein
MKLLSHQDFVTGVVFLAIAFFFGYQSGGYDMGSMGQMGPGYFPMMLSICLGAIGLLQCGKALRASDAPLPSFHLRPVLALLGGILLFGVLITDFGLVVAIFAVILLGSFGGYRYKLLELAALTLILAAFCAAAFVYGLNIQIPVLPRF